MQKTDSPILTEARMDPWKAANQRLHLVAQIMPDKLLKRWLDAVRGSDPVELDLAFAWDEQKRIRVRGKISARASVQCQRCLGEMPIELTQQVDAAVVFSEQAAGQLPAELDPWMGDRDQLDLARQVEDELLLALPMMPVHEQARCAGKAHFSTGDNSEKPAGKKAFAELADLMKKTND